MSRLPPEAVHDAFTLLKKASIERALGTELVHHLAYSSGQAKPQSSQNQRRDGADRH